MFREDGGGCHARAVAQAVEEVITRLEAIHCTTCLPALLDLHMAVQAEVKAEGDLPGVTGFLESLKWDTSGLLAVIAQVREGSPLICRAHNHARQPQH